MTPIYFLLRQLKNISQTFMYSLYMYYQAPKDNQ